MEEHIKRSIHIAKLISNHLDKLPEDYSPEFQEWLAASPKNKEFFKQMIQGEELSSKLDFYDAIDIELTWEQLQNKRAKTKPLYKYLKWVSAAAAVILIPLLLFYFLHTPSSRYQDYTAFTGDLAVPGAVIATLSVGDRDILLDESMRISTEAGMTVTDKTGNSIYKNNREKVRMNRLNVPRGGEYYLVLEDGTKVWVNADSEVQFPDHFVDDKREITVKGEVYLEVAHNPQKPFYVNVGELKVRVLGTSFNICNYENENKMAVTLIDGSVAMETESGVMLVELSPSQQFSLGKEGGAYGVEHVNIHAVLAWKNGDFSFNNESLLSIVKKLERWYDVLIDVDPSLQQKKYSGNLSRQESMSAIISILQKTQELKFVKDENEVIKIIPN